MIRVFKKDYKYQTTIVSTASHHQVSIVIIYNYIYINLYINYINIIFEQVTYMYINFTYILNIFLFFIIQVYFYFLRVLYFLK